jgi:cytochrome c oxidase cbb3-type subunit 2
MPGFQDAFPEADRWALSYYILSLSAFTDPLTATPLPIAPADRAALDNPMLETAGSESAYRLLHP